MKLYFFKTSFEEKLSIIICGIGTKYMTYFNVHVFVNINIQNILVLMSKQLGDFKWSTFVLLIKLQIIIDFCTISLGKDVYLVKQSWP